MLSCKKIPLNTLIALDQLINALCAGWPDETLSSRVWRWHAKGTRSWPMYAIDTLFFWQNSHCLNAYQAEKTGRHLPPEARHPDAH